MHGYSAGIFAGFAVFGRLMCSSCCRQVGMACYAYSLTSVLMRQLAALPAAAAAQTAGLAMHQTVADPAAVQGWLALHGLAVAASQ